MTTFCILCRCHDMETPAEIPAGWSYPICLEHVAASTERSRKPKPTTVITFAAPSLEQACAAAALMGKE
jgi:hypothetical protein